MTKSRSGAIRLRGVHRETRLQTYLDENGIPYVFVATEARVSREQLARWRLGRSDIRRKNMVRILGAVRKKTPDARIEDLFDLDPNNPENWDD